MLTASSHWSDFSSGQRILFVYLMIGFAVVIATQQYLRPRLRRGPGNSMDWEPRDEGTRDVYWLLLLLGMHPITILISVALWPVWLVLVLLLHFFRYQRMILHLASNLFSLDLMRTIRLALLAVAASALVAFSAATFGVFRNETDSTVTVTIVNTRGESSRAHFIQPHDVARFPVTNGTAIARTTSGKALARCNLMPLPVAREYYDFPSRRFYYRITRARIQLVRPEDGREWLRSGLTNR